MTEGYQSSIRRRFIGYEVKFGSEGQGIDWESQPHHWSLTRSGARRWAERQLLKHNGGVWERII